MTKINKSKFNPQFKAIDAVVDFFAMNTDNWYNMDDIEENVNFRKRNRISRETLSRFVKHFLKTYKNKFISKKDGRYIYYLLKSDKVTNTSKANGSKKLENKTQNKSTNYSNTNLNIHGIKATKVKTIVSKISLHKNESEITAENKNERDYYPRVQSLLNKHTIGALKYNFLIEPVRGEPKWLNPDLLGINLTAATKPIVAVEVKIDKELNQLLVGFAQCCSYMTFSDYVYLFCMRPKNQEDVDRVINLCKCHGIGLCFLDNKSLTINIEARLNDNRLTDTKQKMKYQSLLESKLR